MNGFILFMLVVLAGQVSPGGLSMPGSANPVQPASMVQTPPPQTDYGWQVNPKSRELEYIVQISPERAEFMYQNGKEVESVIPAVVAERVSKIVVRFGKNPIVSTPIEEVLELPLVNRSRSEVAANLFNGKIKTLESSQAPDLQNVAGGAQTPLPLNPSLGASLPDEAAALKDRMAEAIRDPDSLLAQGRQNPASSFLQDAMGGGRTAAPFPSAGNPASPSVPNNGMPISTAGPQSTAPPSVPSLGVGSTASPLNPNATGSQLNQLGVGTGTLGLGGANNHGTYPNNGYSNQVGANGMAGTSNQNTYGQNQYGQSTYGQGTNGYGQGQQTTPGGAFTSINPNATGANANLNQSRGNFGQQPLGWPNATGNTGYNGYQGYNATTGQAGLGNQYTSTGSPYLESPSARTADTRGALPGTTGANLPSTTTTSNNARSNWANTRGDGYTHDPYQDVNTALAQRTGMDNIMPVMFVLSLVVNFYLGMLIRKLLGRYRTLLASVRSQAV